MSRFGPCLCGDPERVWHLIDANNRGRGRQFGLPGGAMKDRSIDDFVEALREVHAAHPDMRVGQIIVNSLHASWGNDPFYIENDELVRGMRERLPKVSK